MNLPEVTVEFYGVPRLRAGRPELRVRAATAAAALAAVARACPGLAEVCGADGRLMPAYLLSLDGERFLTDLGERLQHGDRLLLLSADAGG
jgi:molybdopterin converting factor small subunit